MLSIAATPFLSSCGPSPRQGRVVEITCDQGIIFLNYATHEMSAPGPNGILGTYLSGPSLFSIISADENKDSYSYLYLYLPEDGNRIELHFDGDLLYANGRVHSISLDHKMKRNFAEWYASADEPALKSIRLILSEGDFEKEIDEILTVNPDITIWTGDGDDAVSTKGKPLLFTGCFSTNDVINQQELIKQNLTETRILMLDDSMPKTREAWSEKSMPNLYRLILPISPEANTLLDAFPHVKAISFIECDKTSKSDRFQNLGKLRSLEELHLATESENITCDLAQLTNPKALRFLSVGEKSNVVGTELLINLEYLNPGNVEFSDEDLESMLSNHPNLVFLNLIYATIDSLEPLRRAPHLEGVMLGGFSGDAPPDFSPLGNLKRLRYVGLPENMADEPEAVAAIEKVCPRVVIYQHDKFCMGSGWLVLFLPALLLLLLFKWFQGKAREGVR